MRAMFTMMNNARLSVGLEGLSIGERAYQQALAYAQERGSKPTRIWHRWIGVWPPKVRRMTCQVHAFCENSA